MARMDTRTRILEAADRVMRARGIAGATTKIIAREAGVSEGSLYNHFKNKSELFLSVLRESPAPFMRQVVSLRQHAGEGSVRAKLSELALLALTFYRTAIPMGASFFAEPELLVQHRAYLAEKGIGPHKANEALAAYLHAEQALGRLSAGLNPDAAAYLLLGACYQRAYWVAFLGEQTTPEDELQFVEGLLEVLLRNEAA